MYRLFPLFLAIILCRAIRYDNYTLFRGIPINGSQLEFFKNLTDKCDVNFWREPGTLRMPVEFVIAPNYRPKFLVEVKRRGILLTTIMEDVQRAFDKQTVKPYIRRNMQSFDWQSYYRTDDIYTWLRDLESEYSPILKVESIGKTVGGRDILAATIILKGSLHRSKVIMEGGIHAREWISPAFVTFMIHRILLSAESSNENLKKIAKTYEWYFVPIVNPDGYEHSHQMDRLWRKNLNGLGIDLNRNFGYQFGTTGVSFQPETEVFCGKYAFSEKETSALKNFIESKSHKLEYYLSFHSYGQFLIIPYAHSKLHYENFEEMKLMGNAAAKEILSYNGRKYTIGSAYDTVGYTVSGASTCWTKHNFKVPYVMTFELRDTGDYGFALPPNQIVPTCDETLAGLLSLLQPRASDFDMLKLNYEKKYESYVESGQDKVFLLIALFIFNVCIIPIVM